MKEIKEESIVYKVQSKTYRPTVNNTVVNIFQENPYTHFERAINGDWTSKYDEDIIEEVLRVVYLEFNPSSALQELDKRNQDMDAKVAELNSVIIEADSKIAELNSKTEQMNGIVNEVAKQFVLSTELSDEQRETILSQYRIIRVGDTVQPNEIVNIDGELFKMVQGNPVTIVTEDWLKDASIFSPFLQKKVIVEDEDGEEIVVDVVDEFTQPVGGHDAYQTGDKVMFEGQIWRSLIDNNVWSPISNPSGWEEVQ